MDREWKRSWCVCVVIVLSCSFIHSFIPTASHTCVPSSLSFFPSLCLSSSLPSSLSVSVNFGGKRGMNFRRKYFEQEQEQQQEEEEWIYPPRRGGVYVCVCVLVFISSSLHAHNQLDLSIPFFLLLLFGGKN